MSGNWWMAMPSVDLTKARRAEEGETASFLTLNLQKGAFTW